MKKLAPLVPFLVLTSIASLWAQGDPTPAPTPNDIPVAQTSSGNAKAATGTACPECAATSVDRAGKPSEAKTVTAPAACPECASGTGSMPGGIVETPKPAENIEATLTKLEQDWGDAIMHHDVEFIERTEAEDYTYTGPDGVVSHKTDEIAGAKAALANIESFKHHDLKVQVYGDTAVVTGATTLKGKAGDVDLSGNFRWTDVFVRKGDGWQIVASQATPVSRNADEGDQ